MDEWNRGEDGGGRGSGSVGSAALREAERGEGERAAMGWKQGPTQLSIQSTWVPWKGRK